MFRSRERSPEQHLDDFVARARAARDAGERCFQAYLSDGGAMADYETAQLVEVLEGEGWTLENIGHAVEPPDDSGAVIETLTGKVVGTIYAFRAT